MCLIIRLCGIVEQFDYDPERPRFAKHFGFRLKTILPLLYSNVIFSLYPERPPILFNSCIQYDYVRYPLKQPYSTFYSPTGLSNNVICNIICKLI